MSSDFGILAMLFLSVMAGVAGSGYFLLKRSGTATAEDEGPLFDEPGLPSAQAFFAQAFRRVGETMPAANEEANPVRKQLMRAGYRYPSAVPIYYGIKGASALLLAAIAAFVGVYNNVDASAIFLALLCGGGFGFLLPDRVLEFQVSARSDRIRSAIPSALDLMVVGVEAGQSINQAILDTSQVLREAHPDLSAELSQVHLELRAGKSRQEALFHLGERNNDAELKKLSSVLIDSDRFGTSLGPTLRTHAKYLRTRMRQHAQESARKVTVKLIFPVFFLIFPSVLLVTLGPAVLQMMAQFKIMTGQ
ncbi:MAG: type II secretion system F family protein [Bryobacteraceae bacterium]